MNISTKNFRSLQEGWLISFAWFFACTIFFVGVVFVFQGFFALHGAAICGTKCMLVGMTLCLAGGYHAYCLDLGLGALRFGWSGCVILYVLAFAMRFFAS